MELCVWLSAERLPVHPDQAHQKVQMGKGSDKSTFAKDQRANLVHKAARYKTK
jgi:hypothetical protein